MASDLRTQTATKIMRLIPQSFGNLKFKSRTMASLVYYLKGEFKDRSKVGNNVFWFAVKKFYF